MAHYTASIETPRPLAETFAYLSDFSTTEQWDPGVVEAERLGDAPVGEGTEFRLVADFLGRNRSTGDLVMARSTGSAFVFVGTWATGVDTTYDLR